MRKSGYLQSNGDYTLFYKHFRIEKVTTLVVYVNDIIITGSDHAEKVKLDDELLSEFAMKNLRQLKFFMELKWHTLAKGSFGLNRNTPKIF